MKQMLICVDDEKIVLETLKEQLQDVVADDCVIEIADNGQDAIAIVDEYVEEGYHVLMVISDYIMPGMKGDELLTRIHDKYPSIVNILLTGQATFDGIQAIINHASLFRFIQKPWHKEDLALSVHEGIKSYEQELLIKRQNKLLRTKAEELSQWSRSIVETLGKTLDNRDTTTSGHCKRMAEYAAELAWAVNSSSNPDLAPYKIPEDQLESLYYAALLHDIGKIGIREDILLKDARLSPAQLKLIEQRIHLLARHMECEANPRVPTEDEEWLLANQKHIVDTIDAISRCGILSSESQTFLSLIRAKRIRGLDDTEEPLLTQEEMESLSVPKGNLTPAERIIMESHASLTYDILSGIPWPEHLSQVPALAASHHERLDGSGYPKGARDQELSTGTRILAILDVYEALTSENRPYRKQVSNEKALGILYEDALGGKFDLPLLLLFAETLGVKVGDEDE